MKHLKRLMLVTTWVVGLGLVAGAPTAWAEGDDGAETPRADRRQERQEKRIEHGVGSGEINVNEQKRVERRQARIARFEERIKADGKVTPHEARRLERMQDRASRQIHRQRRDRR